MSICHGTSINGANRVHCFVLGTLESVRLENDDASIESLGTKAPPWLDMSSPQQQHQVMTRRYPCTNTIYMQDTA